MKGGVRSERRGREVRWREVSERVRGGEGNRSGLARVCAYVCMSACVCECVRE